MSNDVSIAVSKRKARGSPVEGAVTRALWLCAGRPRPPVPGVRARTVPADSSPGAGRNDTTTPTQNSTDQPPVTNHTAENT